MIFNTKEDTAMKDLFCSVSIPGLAQIEIHEIFVMKTLVFYYKMATEKDLSFEKTQGFAIDIELNCSLFS